MIKEEAIQVLQTALTSPFVYGKYAEAIDMAIEALTSQNLAEPNKDVKGSADKPTGKWKPKNHHTDYCSHCGFEETQWRTADYNFCPSCGVRMKGVDDEHTV